MSKTKRIGGLVLGVVLVLSLMLGAALLGAKRHRSVNCSTHLVASGYDEYWDVGYSTGRTMDLSFNRDAVTTDTGTTLTLSYCSRETVASCAVYDFDTTGDGLGDTNILLDNGTIELGGVRGMSGFNYLRVQETGTWGGTPEITVCRRSD
jgi:hypothetical protein